MTKLTDGGWVELIAQVHDGELHLCLNTDVLVLTLPAVCEDEPGPKNPAFTGPQAQQLISELPAAQIKGRAFRGTFRGHRVGDDWRLDDYRNLTFADEELTNG